MAKKSDGIDKLAPNAEKKAAPAEAVPQTVQEGETPPQPLEETVRNRVSQEMLDLVSSSSVAFLLGAGCSVAAGLCSMPKLTEAIATVIANEGRYNGVWEALKASFGKDSSANVEDCLSELVDHVAVASRREAKGKTAATTNIGTKAFTLVELQAALQGIKGLIASQVRDVEAKLGWHRRFVEAFHRRVRAGRFPSQCVAYFTLNYDMLIESALGMQQIPYVDGMRGGQIGWWDQQEYSRGDVEAAVYKIHGSVDWTLLEGEVFPRRLNPADTGFNDKVQEQVLIWPAATKYREAQRDPFAQLIERFRAALSQSQTVLVVAGYSFGDDHINHEIEGALRRSSGRLQVVVMLGEDTLPATVRNWCMNPSFGKQIRVYYRKGYCDGTCHAANAQDQEWWKFERFIELLEGGV